VQVLEHFLELAVEGGAPETQLAAALRWLVMPVLDAAADGGQQVLTPAALRTIFCRICDPDNPDNLAGTFLTRQTVDCLHY